MESTEGSTVDAPVTAPSRTRGLRPPWQKGKSPNPTGGRKDGKPRGPSPARLRLDFLEAWEVGNTSQRFIAQWLKDALSGPPSIRARAREQILERFWPAIQEAQNSQKTIQLGVRLELSPDSQTPTLTVVASEHTQELPSGSGSSAAVSSLPASLPTVAPPEKSAE